MTLNRREGGMLALFLVASFAVATLGGWATSDAIDGWYRAIEKPTWTPPDWLFAPVWGILYALIGVAGWLAWRTGNGPGAAAPASPKPGGLPLEVRAALAAWWAQLGLNALWSWLFFGWRRIGLALFDIAALWLAIVAATILLWRAHRTAGILFIPYLAWVTFAAALNLAIWRLN